MTFHLRFGSFEGQIHSTLNFDTLVRIFMAGNIVAGKIWQVKILRIFQNLLCHIPLQNSKNKAKLPKNRQI